MIAELTCPATSRMASARSGGYARRTRSGKLNLPATGKASTARRRRLPVTPRRPRPRPMKRYESGARSAWRWWCVHPRSNPVTRRGLSDQLLNFTDEGTGTRLQLRQLITEPEDAGIDSERRSARSASVVVLARTTMDAGGANALCATDCDRA